MKVGLYISFDDAGSFFGGLRLGGDYNPIKVILTSSNEFNGYAALLKMLEWLSEDFPFSGITMLGIGKEKDTIEVVVKHKVEEKKYYIRWWEHILKIEEELKIAPFLTSKYPALRDIAKRVLSE